MNESNCGWHFHDEYSKRYHDERWCKVVHDDHELFAILIMEMMSVGLSWSLLLKREEGLRKTIDHLDPEVIANYDDKKEEELLLNPYIIKNRRKIHAMVNNAKAFLKVQEEFTSFDRYIWSFTSFKVIDHQVRDMKEVPTISDLSIQVSKDLKRRGFTFLGPTIVYSFMQSIGIYNDHTITCPYR